MFFYVYVILLAPCLCIVYLCVRVRARACVCVCLCMFASVCDMKSEHQQKATCVKPQIRSSQSPSGTKVPKFDIYSSIISLGSASHVA